MYGHRGGTTKALAPGLGRPVPSLGAQRCGLFRLPPRPCSSPSTVAQKPGGQPPAISSGPVPQSLEMVSEYVQKNRGALVFFKAQPQLCLRVGDLEGTLYEGQDELLRWCQALYLPQPTRMIVVGTVDDVPCLATGQQLVILVAESGDVYAYEEETLHKVARSFAEFLEIGLQLLGKEVYCCGEHIVPLVSWAGREGICSSSCLGKSQPEFARVLGSAVPLIPPASVPNSSLIVLPTG